MIHDENNVLTDDEFSIVRAFLKRSKYVHLYIRNARGLKVLSNMYKIKMDKTSKQVTKNYKRQECELKNNVKHT